MSNDGRQPGWLEEEEGNVITKEKGVLLVAQIMDVINIVTSSVVNTIFTFLASHSLLYLL